LIPQYSDDQDVPELVPLLGAVLVRSHDREWVEDMLAQLEVH
jgi:hypothetical protein